jgi:hypothetical protein
MNAWRGTALILEKSHLYVSGRVLRHPLTRAIVATPNSQKAAETFCRQNGYSWMKPTTN